MYDLVDLAFTGLLLLIFMLAFLSMLTLNWSSPGLSMKTCMLMYLQDHSLVQLLLSGKYRAVSSLAKSCGAKQTIIYENGVKIYGQINSEKCNVLTSIQVPVPDRRTVYTVILCR